MNDSTETRLQFRAMGVAFYVILFAFGLGFLLAAWGDRHNPIHATLWSLGSLPLFIRVYADLSGWFAGGVER